MGTTYSLQTD